MGRSVKMVKQKGEVFLMVPKRCEVGQEMTGWIAILQKIHDSRDRKIRKSSFVNQGNSGN